MWLGHHRERQPAPVDVGAWPIEVQLRGDLVVTHRQDDLDQARQARGRLGVANIRLHRANKHARTSLAITQHGCQCTRLDRVTQRGAGAVSLDVLDPAGLDRRVAQRRADDSLLRRAVGHRQAATAAVLINRAAPDHSADAIAIGQRIAQSLQDDHAAALRPAETIGVGVKRLASAVRRQHPSLRECDVESGPRIRFTPPAKASRHSPARRLWQAR